MCIWQILTDAADQIDPETLKNEALKNVSLGIEVVIVVIEAIAETAKCFLQRARNVATSAKCHFALPAADPFIVVTVLKKTVKRVDPCDLIPGHLDLMLGMMAPPTKNNLKRSMPN